MTDDPPRFQRLAPRFLGVEIEPPEWISPDELYAQPRGRRAEDAGMNFLLPLPCVQGRGDKSGLSAARTAKPRECSRSLNAAFLALHTKPLLC